ncbi:MAG: caspase family protein, partial [Deltaproteobacteria bacterium]
MLVGVLGGVLATLSVIVSTKVLGAAVNDATMIEKLLKESYGFESRLLLNATRKDILSAINEFRNKLA